MKPPFGKASALHDSRAYNIGTRWELMHGDYVRALQCIAACAGMSDPVEQVRGLHIARETLAIVAAERDALRAERDGLAKQAKRYEIVRRWGVGQFSAAIALNLSTGKHFDEIVDDFEPFHSAALARSQT